MSNISSGYTHLLQNQALRNDKKNALLKVQKTWKPPCCPNNIKPLPQLVSTCSFQSESGMPTPQGDDFIPLSNAGLLRLESGQQSSSTYLTRHVTNGNYNYVGIKCGVPESVRLQQLVTNTANALYGIPVRNIDGSFSYLPDPSTRFSQYAPYKPPPCPAPLPYYATNAGNPVANIPPCISSEVRINTSSICLRCDLTA